MLRQLRKKKIAKRVLWVLAILIVPAFVLWGAGSATRSRPKTPSHVGRIYSKKITFEKFAKGYEAYYHQLMLSTGGDPKLLKRLIDSVNINLMAWNRLIVLEEVKRERIKVADKEIMNAIASHPLFRRGGTFDKGLYTYIIRNNLRTTPREFEEEVRQDIAINKLKDKVLKDVSVSEDEISQEYKKENEKIKISFILINPEDFLKDIQLSKEELEVFYQENKEDFRKGEEVNIKYLYIDPDNTELLYKVTEDINSNKDFENIAKQNNLEIEETGFFSMNEEIPKIGLSYELIKMAFTLDKGMTSPPIYTQKGHYIINVKEKRKGYLPSFQDVEPLLNKELIKIKSTEMARISASKIYKELNDAIEQGASFEKAAKKINLELMRSKPFSRREYIEGIGQADSLKEMAFALPKGKINPPVGCEKGFVILSVDELIPIDEKKFTEEKDKFAERLLAQKKFVAFNKWFEKISKNAKLEINLGLLPR